ncbi:hypothetical protein L1987_49783 [Smallanthus sonchifolius]|uniref:Uncharacterized protein n=1 Tax=Smallanthus sonchifolius TaxID=185202 RepID=A0ACB9FVG6_9ASTR|nr:hypothetical protein L1987_49783 [Smallanthus sonchifolius]
MSGSHCCHNPPAISSGGESGYEALKLRTMEQAVEFAKPVIQALKGKGITKIGAAGFCWGGVKVPIAILSAEIDNLSPPELIKEFEAALVANEPPALWQAMFSGVGGSEYAPSAI